MCIASIEEYEIIISFYLCIVTYLEWRQAIVKIDFVLTIQRKCAKSVYKKVKLLDLCRVWKHENSYIYTEVSDFESASYFMFILLM